MKTIGLIIIVAIGSMLCVSRVDAQSHGAMLDNNLIVNGGAEQGAGAPDNSEVLVIPGWTTQGHFNVVQYGANGGFADMSSPGPDDRGKNYFIGGPNNRQSSATQTIDVSALASNIDHAQLFFAFSGYLGGYASQNDATTLSASFKDADGDILRSFVLGPVMAVDRSNVTGLIKREVDGSVPAGTRSILVEMLMIRTDGSYNDGSADNLSLVFSLSGVASSTVVLGTAAAPNASAVQQQSSSVATAMSRLADISLTGKWSSNWGPVEFNDDLTGSWNQGVGIGQITSGRYDVSQSRLVFQYYQPWNKMYGNVTMTLSYDGNMLSGRWRQERAGNKVGTGGSGRWTMWRRAPVTATRPDASAGQDGDARGSSATPDNSIFNWTDVPQDQMVPVEGATFDEGGYQLYDTVGETIIVPFENGNLYAMKFAVSRDENMYFVNDGDAPILYLPLDGYLLNATVSDARWYPFSPGFDPAEPVFIGMAPSWDSYTDMGWYPGMSYAGGYWYQASSVRIAPMTGFFILIDGRYYYDWPHYRDYCRNHPGWYHPGYFHRDYYYWAGRQRRERPTFGAATYPSIAHPATGVTTQYYGSAPWRPYRRVQPSGPDGQTRRSVGSSTSIGIRSGGH